MKEVSPENSFGFTSPESVRYEYGTHFVGLLERWRLYRYAESPFDYYSESLKLFAGKSGAKVLDIGTYDGAEFASAANTVGIRGELYGIDPVTDAYELKKDLNMNVDVNFVQAKSEALPFASNSMDGIVALFSAYHFDPLEKALAEMRRVLKPGGTVAISTSGKSNKSQHRYFESQISEFTGLAKPPIFTRSFDIDTAHDVLPRWFDTVTFIPQHTRMLITPGSAFVDYIGSLLTVNNSITRNLSEKETVSIRDLWKAGVDAVATPQIEHEIAMNGVFVDYIDRGLFICRNLE